MRAGYPEEHSTASHGAIPQCTSALQSMMRCSSMTEMLFKLDSPVATPLFSTQLDGGWRVTDGS